MTSTCAKHRGRPKATADADLRRAVAVVASRLFIEKGYGATTTEEIAACCKISKQTLYRLFSGKDALFAAVIELTRPHWLDLSVSDEVPLQAALETIFCVDISEDEARERMQFLWMTLTEGRLYPELYEILKKCGSGPGLLTLAAWLQRQADAGRIELMGDARHMADLLGDMVFGSLLRRTVGGLEWKSNADWRAHASLAIKVFLYGAGVRPKH